MGFSRVFYLTNKQNQTKQPLGECRSIPSAAPSGLGHWKNWKPLTRPGGEEGGRAGECEKSKTMLFNEKNSFFGGLKIQFCLKHLGLKSPNDIIHPPKVGNLRQSFAPLA